MIPQTLSLGISRTACRVARRPAAGSTSLARVPAAGAVQCPSSHMQLHHHRSQNRSEIQCICSLLHRLLLACCLSPPCFNHCHFVIFCNTFCIFFGSCCGSFGCHVGVILGSCWGHFGVFLMYLRGYSFDHPFSSILDASWGPS